MAPRYPGQLSRTYHFYQHFLGRYELFSYAAGISVEGKRRHCYRCIPILGQISFPCDAVRLFPIASQGWRKLWLPRATLVPSFTRASLSSFLSYFCCYGTVISCGRPRGLRSLRRRLFLITSRGNGHASHHRYLSWPATMRGEKWSESMRHGVSSVGILKERRHTQNKRTHSGSPTHTPTIITFLTVK